MASIPKADSHVPVLNYIFSDISQAAYNMLVTGAKVIRAIPQMYLDYFTTVSK